MILKNSGAVIARTIWRATAIFVVLFVVFGLYVHAEKQIDRANEQRQTSYQLADQLRQSSDDLTRMVTAYVETGEPRYKEYYQDILDIRDGKKAQPEGYFYVYWDLVLANSPLLNSKKRRAAALLDVLRQSGCTGDELTKLAEAKANSDSLAAMELDAMRLSESRGEQAEYNRQKARGMLFDARYLQAKAKVMEPINEFYVLMEKRTAEAVYAATRTALIFRFIFIAATLVAIFMLWRVYAALSRAMGGSVDEVSAHIARIGRGDFSATIRVSDNMQNSVLGRLSAMQINLARAAIEREHAEETQRDSESRLSAILDNVLDGIITIGERGTIESFNKAAERIFGYTAAEVIGRNVKILMPEPYHSEHDGYLRNYVSTCQRKIIGIGRQVVGQRKDGSTFPMDLAVSEMQLGDKRMFTGIVRDITERVKIERMKSEFISTVSHELRTPLTSIRGALALIIGGVVGELPATLKPLVEIAHKNSERLILLVNDILDMEKIEAGKMEFDMQQLELMPLVEQALDSNRAYGQQFNVSYELESSLPGAMIKADSNRLMQVMANLLSNAAKFSPSGGKVFVAVESQGERVCVSVKDNGPGISEEFKGQIFQKFAQADSSDTKKKGGTGLGLSITRAIVEQMGGRIGFMSQPNQSTTFFVEFPLCGDTSAQVSAAAPEKKRVLICEDDRDIAALLRLMLEQAGLATDIAYDAAQAKQMLMQSRYAAMTLDLSMPNQDGISLIRELRAAQATADLPIVVVSANANEGRRELIGDAFSVIDWIGKPIDQALLVAALKQAIGQVAQTRAQVLHIEDDPDIVQVVHAIVGELADVDHAVTLAAARRMLTAKHYDLAILDISLPDGSGLDLLPELNRAVPPVPVMVFSASEIRQGDLSTIKSALVKSRTDNAQLLATVKRLIGME